MGSVVWGYGSKFGWLTRLSSWPSLWGLCWTLGGRERERGGEVAILVLWSHFRGKFSLWVPILVEQHLSVFDRWRLHDRILNFSKVTYGPKSSSGIPSLLIIPGIVRGIWKGPRPSQGRWLNWKNFTNFNLTNLTFDQFKIRSVKGRPLRVADWL